MMKSAVQSLSDHGCCIWCHFTIIIMPRWAEPRRHTVVGLCVCLSAGFLVARWKLSDETSYTTKLDICSEMNCKNFGYKAWFVSYALLPDLPQVDTCKVRVLDQSFLIKSNSLLPWICFAADHMHVPTTFKLQIVFHYSIIIDNSNQNFTEAPWCIHFIS